MVAGVNTLTTVFSASSPFIVADDRQTSAPSQTESTLLTPQQDSSKTADIANIFTPAASITALSTDAASILLTEQAREKPIILQNPNPPLNNSPLGNLDIYEELLTASLAPKENRGSEENSFRKDSVRQDSFGKIENQNIVSDTSTSETFAFTSEKEDIAPSGRSFQAEKTAFTSAIAAYQQASPALTGVAPSSVDISA